MSKTSVLTKVPNKSPFPEIITVKSSGTNMRYRLAKQCRSKDEANEYLFWYRKKHGSEVIMMKRGVWYLVYAW